MSVDRLVELVVTILVASFMLPLAIDELLDVDTSEWPALLQTVFEFAPIMVGVAFLVGIVAFIRRRRGRDE